MQVVVSTDVATVEVLDDGDRGYSPDVMNDLCARAVTTAIDVHRRLSALDDEIVP